MNEFVRFYEENGISPVSQDISDLELHIKRRERLYRLLGIDSRLFKDADILEVGAGSGYNTLVFLLLGAKVDIVEPNQVGRREMQKLFDNYSIDPKRYRIYDCVIEKYESSKKYDFVIAEGFLPAFGNSEREKILQALLKQVSHNTYLIFTTICEFSYFFEYLRRILGIMLVKNIVDFPQKVYVLSQAFKKHLDMLKFASRPIDDWVEDTILNPVNDNFSFAISDGIKQLRDIYALNGENEYSFEVIGVSPDLVVNLSWYKDLEYSHTQQIIDRFSCKRHLLLCTEFEDSVRDPIKNNRLFRRLVALRKLIEMYRKHYGNDQIFKINQLLRRIVKENMDLGKLFIASIEEVILLLDDDNLVNIENISSMKHFSKAWGRGQQYVCIKKAK